jgi:hypothetical protein
MMEDENVLFQMLEPLSDEAIKEKELLLKNTGMLVSDLIKFLSDNKKNTTNNNIPDEIFTYQTIVLNFTKRTLEM